MKTSERRQSFAAFSCRYSTITGSVKIKKEKQTLKTLKLRKNCPNTEFFCSVFSPNKEKYGPEKLRIWTLFTQCDM